MDNKPIEEKIAEVLDKGRDRTLSGQIRSIAFGLGALVLSALFMLLSVQISDPEHRRVSIGISLVALISVIVFLDRKIRGR